MAGKRSSGCLLFFLLVPFCVCAQDQGAEEEILLPLTGHVLDAESGESLLGTHVFYEGTTIGDVTDENGRFELPSPPFEQVTLIVSMLGFDVQRQRIESITHSDEELEFNLVPVVFELGEVLVESESMAEWRRNQTRFRELLFSTTDLGEECQIENPEVLELDYSSEANNLVAKATAPLLLTNPSLGYHLTIHGLTFEGNQRAYQFTGGIQFTEADPESEIQAKSWRRKREGAYQGSMRHFLTALVNDQLKKQGFEAYHVASAGEVNTNMPVAELGIKSLGSNVIGGLISQAGTPSTWWLQFNAVVLVQYRKDREAPAYDRYLNRYAPSESGREIVPMGKNQKSWILLPQGFALIDDSGHVFPGMDGYPLAHYGYWGWERFGEMLPADYIPTDG